MFRSGWQILWFSVALSLSGCGYTLQHRLKDTFTHSRGIFVPVFDNHTDEIGAERVFTNALLRELTSRGEVILSSRAEGGLEFKGTLNAIDIKSTAITELGFKGLQFYRRLPSELGVSIQVHLQLVDPKTNATVWSRDFAGFRRVNPLLNRTFNYEAPSSTGIVTQSYYEIIYENIARDMMRDVYDEMVELF